MVGRHHCSRDDFPEWHMHIKSLRKKLVEDCLVGVISLPTVYFNHTLECKDLHPYFRQRTQSKVRQAFLLFCKELRTTGFTLGASKESPISKNDLPTVSSKYVEIISGDFSPGDCLQKTYS